MNTTTMLAAAAVGALGLVAFAYPCAAGDASPGWVVRVDAIAPVPARPGETVTVQIPLEVAEGFHVQANPASEPGFVPLEVELAADAPVSWQAAYPAADPWRITEDEEPLLTYLGRVQVAVTVRIPAGARPGDLAFHGSIRYQACNERWCFAPAAIPVAFLVRVVGD